MLTLNKSLIEIISPNIVTLKKEAVLSKEMLQELAYIVRDALQNRGYLLIKNLPISPRAISECKSLFLELSSLVGKPISHDAHNSIIWDIKSKPASQSLIKTYSEHSHEAELHTDSQYSEYPEDYFGLLTLKKAACGGGESLLLSLKDILKELRQHSEAEMVEQTLRNSNYPFIVPNVFKKSQSDEPEFNFGPILRDNEIRFRVDTFEKAIKACNSLCTPQQIHAYRVLKSIILNSPSTKHFFLEERDLLFINNKTMLHGRNQFKDASRHLLRIRLNKN